ncbi:DNA translocase FtsK [Leuconostocaceae bacterium ESL0958]|nr:DNA translocase FtsK [Leuconostocaceae bacterium ESL0958]
MAQKRKKPSSKKKESRQETAGKVVFLLSFILLSFFAFFKIGLFGLYLANIYRLLVGNLYHLLLLPLVFLAAAYLVLDRPYPVAKRVYAGGGLLLLAAFLLSDLLFFSKQGQPSGSYLHVVTQTISQDLAAKTASSPVGAGLVGALLYQLTYTLLSNIGVVILILTFATAGLVVLFRLPARDMAQQGIAKTQDSLSKYQAVKQEKKKQRQILAKKQQQNVTDFGADPFEAGDNAANAAVSHDPDFAEQPAVAEKAVQPEALAPKINWQQPTLEEAQQEKDGPQSAKSAKAEQPAAADQESNFDTTPTADADYQLPSTDLLTKTKPTDQRQEAASLADKSRLVHDTLQSFGVEATVSSVSLGPTVTQYELKPGQGVKVNRIANLADDLALALAAKSIRIEAPIPGKPYVGIEVPNDTQSVVGFRDMIEHSNTFEQGLLTVPLGRDVTGEIISADLAAMPHLLIAGSTGSGKSVGLNGIIISLLLKAKPSEVKLMMVDPKVVELSIYNGIPHLLTPVVSDPKKAAKSLQKLVDEMENRYDLLAEFGKRNIGEYNAAVDENNRHAAETGHAIMTKLPYIVAVVDEFADLMATVGSEIEVSIARLGAKARAAGIHMILATQRPDVKVINGTIKSNIPGRIAFRTASGIDSRTILDSNGAEKLLGRGDMIFAPPGKAHKRVQGAFIANEDVTAVVDFVKSEQQAVYDDDMAVTDEEIAADEAGGGQSDDELFDEALAFVVEQQKASTSLLQRRFRIGYNRAARLIDDLEASGYVGPADGAKPRQVNVAKKMDDENQ